MELVPIGSIRLPYSYYRYEPKEHELDEIRASFEKFWFLEYRPLVLTRRYETSWKEYWQLLCWFKRYRVAKEMGMEEVPVAYQIWLSDKEEEELRVADNSCWLWRMPEEDWKADTPTFGTDDREWPERESKRTVRVKFESDKAYEEFVSRLPNRPHPFEFEITYPEGCDW